MKVYLAAQYARRDELREYRTQLETLGIHVTSRWLDENEPLDGSMTHKEDAWYTHTALIDLEDINRADAMVFFSEDPLMGIPRGGRHVEFGYAIAKIKPIHVVGPRENVFHYIGFHHVRHYKSLDEFIEAYKRYEEYLDEVNK